MRKAAEQPASRRLIVAADGGSRGNPGAAGYGAVVADAVTGEVLTEVAQSIGIATNNVAEYRALIAGLTAAAQVASGAAVEVRMDSKLVVEQMAGRWKVKHPDLRPLARLARAAASAFAQVSYAWVPRDQNRRADQLANDAMDRAERLPRPGTPPAAGAGPAAGTGPLQARFTTDWAARHPGRPTATVLLRHGQTPLSVDRRFAGTGDIELTAHGAVQAKAAARRLADRGDIGVILTSPLRRTRETAEEVARLTGAPLCAEPDLREADFGAWEGLTFAEAEHEWPAVMAAWLADAHTAPPGGESFAEVDRRVCGALDRLLARYGGTTVLVVSHVTPIKTLVRHALLAPVTALYRMHLDVASLSEIHWYADGPAVMRSFNDTAHLAGLA